MYYFNHLTHSDVSSVPIAGSKKKLNYNEPTLHFNEAVT